MGKIFRKVFVDALGCPKNEYDSQVLKNVLIRRGYELVDSFEDADLIFLNTCGFINDAKLESIERIFSYLRFGKKLVVHGCLVQRYFSELSKEIPEVFAFFGLDSPENILNELEKIHEIGNTKIRKRNHHPIVIYDEPPLFRDERSFAYVKIGDGCDRRCTFCSIPKFKGKHVSRRLSDIIRDVVGFIEMGKKEIILVDQDCTQYRDGEYRLKDLLKILSDLDGDFWIRVLYLNPDFLDDETIDAILETPKVLPYFDIPLQHVSSNVLKAMGRMKGSDELIDLVDGIKRRNEEAVIRSSFIVGFPNETEKDFDELVEFVRSGRIDRMGFFIYSPEEGTKAYEIDNIVDEDEAKGRYNLLTDVSFEIMREKQEMMLGRKLKILVDDYDEDLGMFFGRSYMDAPEIDTVVYIESNDNVERSEFVEIVIDEIHGLDLGGKMVEYSESNNHL